MWKKTFQSHLLHEAELAPLRVLAMSKNGSWPCKPLPSSWSALTATSLNPKLASLPLSSSSPFCVRLVCLDVPIAFNCGYFHLFKCAVFIFFLHPSAHLKRTQVHSLLKWNTKSLPLCLHKTETIVRSKLEKFSLADRSLLFWCFNSKYLKKVLWKAL